MGDARVCWGGWQACDATRHPRTLLPPARPARAAASHPLPLSHKDDDDSNHAVTRLLPFFRTSLSQAPLCPLLGHSRQQPCQGEVSECGRHRSGSGSNFPQSLELMSRGAGLELSIWLADLFTAPPIHIPTPRGIRGVPRGLPGSEPSHIWPLPLSRQL